MVQLCGLKPVSPNGQPWSNRSPPLFKRASQQGTAPHIEVTGCLAEAKATLHLPGKVTPYRPWVVGKLLRNHKLVCQTLHQVFPKYQCSHLGQKIRLSQIDWVRLMFQAPNGPLKPSRLNRARLIIPLGVPKGGGPRRLLAASCWKIQMLKPKTKRIRRATQRLSKNRCFLSLEMTGLLVASTNFEKSRPKIQTGGTLGVCCHGLRLFGTEDPAVESTLRGLPAERHRLIFFGVKSQMLKKSTNGM